MNACFDSRIVTSRVSPTQAAKAGGVRGARRARTMAVKPPPARGSTPYVQGGGQPKALTLDTSSDVESGRSATRPTSMMLFQNVAGSTRKRGRVTAAAMPRPMRITRRAVSYTHLRAHETVLDLVCR